MEKHISGAILSVFFGLVDAFVIAFAQSTVIRGEKVWIERRRVNFHLLTCGARGKTAAIAYFVWNGMRAHSTCSRNSLDCSCGSRLFEQITHGFIHIGVTLHSRTFDKIMHMATATAAIMENNNNNNNNTEFSRQFMVTNTHTLTHTHIMDMERQLANCALARWLISSMFRLCSRSKLLSNELRVTRPGAITFVLSTIFNKMPIFIDET